MAFLVPDDEDLRPDDPHRALGDINLDDLEYNAPYTPSNDNGGGSSNSNAADNRGGFGFGSRDNEVPPNLFGATTVTTTTAAKKKKKKVEPPPLPQKNRPVFGTVKSQAYSRWERSPN